MQFTFICVALYDSVDVLVRESEKVWAEEHSMYSFMCACLNLPVGMRVIVTS
jgi:hypothetical protein